MKTKFFFVLIFFLLFPGFNLRASQSDCFKSIPDIYKALSPSVVLISSTTTNQFAMKDNITTSYGSGFIYSEDGLILTNSHIVFKSDAIIVKLFQGGTFPAVIVGIDPIMDVAVLKIQNVQTSLPVAPLMADDQPTVIGEEVLVIGNPAGMENTVSRGIISGLNRVLPTSPMSMMVPLIQTDAPVSLGNSGGPIVNLCGEVIGMVTAVVNGEGKIGLALPIQVVRQAIPQLLEHGRIRRPWLGVHGKLITKAEIESIFKITIADGFLVETVDPGSPSERVGIKGGMLPIIIAGEEFLFGGDIITAANDIAFNNIGNFETFVRTMKIGDKIKLTVFREGQAIDFEFTVPERPVLPEDLSAYQSR